MIYTLVYYIVESKILKIYSKIFSISYCILYSLAALVRKILFSPLEDEIHIFAPSCNILYICISYIIDRKILKIHVPREIFHIFTNEDIYNVIISRKLILCFRNGDVCIRVVMEMVEMKLYKLQKFFKRNLNSMTLQFRVKFCYE